MSDKNTLRYIAYVRKSEERKERQELSHQSQIKEIKKSFPNLRIVKWIEAESKSAFKPGRPLFNEMVQMIMDGEADGIVAWHPNRLARNEVDSSTITYMLRKELKDLKFCSFNFDNTAEGVMMLQMVMNQSQYESSKQGRDVKRGMEQKAENGERPGQVPQGYMKVPVLDERGLPMLRSKDNKVIMRTGDDPDRFELVSKMWRMLLSGNYNASQICKIATNDWNYITRKNGKIGGGPMHSSMIYKIFNNPFYAGWISHNGELFKGNHNAMISLNDFDYAQTLLGDKGKPRVGVFDYAFSGLIKCGECDCSIVGKTNTKFVKRDNKMAVYVHYYCTRKSESRPCTQKKYTRVEDMHQQIDEELSKYTILPEFREIALKVLNRNNKIEVKDRTGIYKMQQHTREEIQKRLDKLVDMRTRDLLDDDEYMVQKNKLKSELIRTDDSLRGTEQRADEWLELTERAFDFATYARVRFADGSLMDKRDVLRTLGKNFTLKDGKLEITPNEWLIPIAEGYPELEVSYRKVRTNKKASAKELEEALVPIYDTWRARWGLNPRHPA